MGTCLSKKATNASSPTVLPDPPAQTKANTPDPNKKIASTTEHQEILKKEIFVTKHRRSHEIERRKEEEKSSSDKEQVLEISQPGNVNNAPGCGGNGVTNVVMAATPVRISSCTKEELDAILIQCGRLSRSSSTGKAGSGENPNFVRSGRKYSGTKRSYDFDQEVARNDDSGGGGGRSGDEVVAEVERIHRHRNQQREPRVSSPSSSRRRRTPSRERDEQGNSQARSGSRERVSGNGGGRRVSRSPGRRSESPITNSNGGQGGSSSGNADRPGKMVSVPATVSSMAMDKSNNGGGEVAMGGGNGGVRRIPVKKNAGDATTVGSRTSASPRARSPARASARVTNENQNQELKQQPLSLSRSNSRKAEISPYRRNPLGDIDNNVPGNDQTKQPNKKGAVQKPNGEKMSSNKTSTNRDNKTKEQQIVDETREDLHSTIANVAVTLVPPEAENLKLQGLTRTRSSRRSSRDFDIINPETLLNPNPSYTSLLLDDIQNFHQKGTPQPAFSLPSCLTKACSILEAVADLNSTTSSNLSSTFSEDRRKNLIKKNDEKNLLGGLEEPELEVMDGDLAEPTLHKYVTFRRGPTPTGGEDMEEQESSGSNSFAGSQQVNWLSSSWEPTSGDSSNCWTSSSKSNTREKDFNNPLGFQKSAVSETGYEKKREMDNQRNGIGRGRLGSGRSAFSMPNAASASS